MAYCRAVGIGSAPGNRQASRVCLNAVQTRHSSRRCSQRCERDHRWKATVSNVIDSLWEPTKQRWSREEFSKRIVNEYLYSQVVKCHRLKSFDLMTPSWSAYGKLSELQLVRVDFFRLIVDHATRSCQRQWSCTRATLYCRVLCRFQTIFVDGRPIMWWLIPRHQYGMRSTVD